MFHHVLAAIDHSDLGMQVFERAVKQAKLTQAKLMLVHVISPEDQGYPSFPAVPGIDTYFALPQNEASIKAYLEAWHTYEQQGLDKLKSLAETATQAGVSTEFSQLQGAPGRVICELAKSWGADLIVLGRRGRMGVNELFLGSVSNYVMHHAACSVLTLQNLSS
jgi:nucleotide-binding universal stress UspA family protein